MTNQSRSPEVFNFKGNNLSGGWCLWKQKFELYLLASRKSLKKYEIAYSSPDGTKMEPRVTEIVNLFDSVNGYERFNRHGKILRTWIDLNKNVHSKLLTRQYKSIGYDEMHWQ
ncbi:hypothetical protein FQA39_LY17927 [Lamprigera yunnana]|nr:hypothetical protein FQA39_LY17927 [Lamprigera yunnana]